MPVLWRSVPPNCGFDSDGREGVLRGGNPACLFPPGPADMKRDQDEPSDSGVPPRVPQRGGGSGLEPPHLRRGAPGKHCCFSNPTLFRLGGLRRLRHSAIGLAPGPVPPGTGARWLHNDIGVAPYFITGYLVDPASSICLSQRLSHASLSTHGRYSETANGSLNQLWFL